MWMPYNFDTAKMGKELALAEDIGFNCLRVVLPFVVWEHDPEAFKKRLNAFLEVCDRHGLRVMFALFDDCAFGSDAALKNPRYGKQPDVLAGRSNDVTVCLQNSREATPCRAPLNQGQSAHARRPGQVHERAVNLV